MTPPAGHAIRVLRGEVQELWITAIESKPVALDAVEILSGADPSEIKYESEMASADIANLGFFSGETRKVDTSLRTRQTLAAPAYSATLKFCLAPSIPK
jgi:hypothetical protein